MRSSRAVHHPLGGVALSVDGVGSLLLEGDPDNNSHSCEPLLCY